MDTVVFIYLLEGHPDFLQQRGQYLASHSNATLLTSTLTLAEYGVKPYRDQKLSLIQDFHDFLEESSIKMQEITERIADRAAQLRASYPSIKIADAIQLATALETSCDTFLTNDQDLTKVEEIDIVILSEL